MDIIAVVFFFGAGFLILFDARKRSTNKEVKGKEIKAENKLKIQIICGYGLIAAAISLLIVEIFL